MLTGRYLRGAAVALLSLTLVAGCASSGSDRSTGEVVDDSSVSSRVKTALLRDRQTDGMDIEVEVNRGRVQLLGVADSEEEKQRAGEIARSVKGVVAVSNNLQVAASRSVGEYLDDKVLLTRVTAALARADGVVSRSIEVEVNRNTVQLGGFVRSLEEKAAAEAAVNRVKGVRGVINNLDLRK